MQAPRQPSGPRTLSIAVKELVPVIIAATLFGSQWSLGHLIQLSVDNMSVVHILNSTYSRDPHLLHWFASWCSLQLTLNFGFKQFTLKENQTVSQTHCLATIQPISCLRQSLCKISATLMILLGNIQDWTAPQWIAMFSNVLRGSNLLCYISCKHLLISHIIWYSYFVYSHRISHYHYGKDLVPMATNGW